MRIARTGLLFPFSCGKHFPCVYVHHMCARCLLRPEEGVMSAKPRVSDGCGLSCGRWEPSLGPLQELQRC